MSLQQTGIITKIGEVENPSPTFKKRSVIIDVSDRPEYPNPVNFELLQTKVDLADFVSVGQRVEVHFNLRGREWVSPNGEVKYFTTLAAWKIQAEQVQQAAPAPSVQDQSSMPL